MPTWVSSRASAVKYGGGVAILVAGFATFQAQRPAAKAAGPAGGAASASAPAAVTDEGVIASMIALNGYHCADVVAVRSKAGGTLHVTCVEHEGGKPDTRYIVTSQTSAVTKL